MAVDVVADIVIDQPVGVVAACAADPSNAPEWYANIRAVEWKTEPPIRVGSRLAFVAHFLGRRLAYPYEVVEWVPQERLVMRTAEGPFLVAPLMASAMRRANRKDLAKLKSLLETRAG